MKISKIISATLMTLIVVSAPVPVSAADNNAAARAERRYVDAGNRLYREKRYSEAETQYKKALEANASSALASYNLAASLLRQANPGESGKKLISEAQKMLGNVLSQTKDMNLAQLAAYNLGNIAYNSQQWDESIKFYKEALRRNPDNDKARENLRLAQLKKREQDKNKDQNKEQDKNQDKDQNKNQNKDQNKEQDKNQDKPQPQNPEKDKQQPQQPPQPQNGMSKENAEKILKAMENEEAATRRRVQEAEKKKGAAARRIVGKPW